ncbi:Serine/threonine-protein kinase MRCK alpha [Liparis tanakae]|uniref:Serine/threonine-protein kinase MRCK alpha n=1 Tax=Liparis tanakae TaxID=230148 RepID=A0A4Z2E7P8_9TELE|nr:Serine/threonine-protein kinase MRCK alpha [Liparis tanakae]
MSASSGLGIRSASQNGSALRRELSSSSYGSKRQTMTSPSESSLSSGGGVDCGDAPLSQFDREVSERTAAEPRRPPSRSSPCRRHRSRGASVPSVTSPAPLIPLWQAVSPSEKTPDLKRALRTLLSKMKVMSTRHGEHGEHHGTRRTPRHTQNTQNMQNTQNTQNTCRTHAEHAEHAEHVEHTQNMQNT